MKQVWAESEAARKAAEAQVEVLQATVDSLQDQLAALEVETEAESVKPDLMQILSDNHMNNFVQDDGPTFASMKISEAAFEGSGLSGLLRELGFSEAIMSRIGATLALDGTQTVESGSATASWTYHPDNGLSLIVELK
ncbi:MAG: hypothetical protein WB239_12615 [Acidimicrobiia bacterium]